MRTRRSILIALGGAVVVAAAIAATLVIVSRGGSNSSTQTQTQTAVRSALFAGIPQHGLELGNSSAPPLYEYADLQCPYCAEASQHVLPAVIRDYVRTGKVKLVFHGLAFVGPDSQKALSAVFAAGDQNRLWDVLHELYARQGPENSGWVTDDLLKQVGASVAGLDVDRWLSSMDSDNVKRRYAVAAQAATEAGINATPTFVFGGQQLQLTSLDAADFRKTLDPLLGE